MKFAEHFTRSEFACKCGCGEDTVDAELVVILERVREYFGAPVTINSGFRCKKYNKRIGGKPKSQHLRGRAADITVKDVNPARVYVFLHTWHTGGLGKYDTFTHIDTRNAYARW